MPMQFFVMTIDALFIYKIIMLFCIQKNKTLNFIKYGNLKHITTFKTRILLKQQGNVLNFIENIIHLFPI